MPAETTLRLPAARPGGKSAQDVARQALVKVPEVTLYFWIIKLLTTALGESTSDYLVHKIDPVIAVLMGAAGFAVAITLQLVVRRYIAWVYWLAVVMVALFGTMGADVVHIVLGVPYLFSTMFFAFSLAVIFGVWYLSEQTLSVHSIYTTRRELFYWAAIIATFALGTAAGDMMAYTLHLGFFTAGVVFCALFALPALGYFLFRLNAIVAFWVAYVLTRPIGASFADWTGKLHNEGGLGLGAGHVSFVLALLVAAFVGYLAVTRKDIQRDQAQ